jgi:hemoglobin
MLTLSRNVIDMMKREIINRDDIKLLVESFYSRVMKDDVIGDIFNQVLYFSWDTHIPIMINFWETMLLDTGNYRGNLMVTHIELNKTHPLTPEHFERWKKLFFETLDEHFTGENVTEAKKRVENMEALMQYKIAQSTKSGFIQ